MDDADCEMSTRISSPTTLFFIVVLLCSRALADWNVGTEFRIVRVPVRAGVEIVEQFSEERTTPDAMNALAALIEKGEATVVTELFGKGLSGTQQRIEEIEEFRYPVQFESPHPQLAPISAVGVTLPAVPSYWETKYTGTLFQSEIEVSDDGLFLTGIVSCRNVRHIGNLRYEYGVRANGLKYYTSPPKFLIQKNDTSVLMRSGLPTLIGSFVGAEASGGMDLHIVTIKASRIGESVSLEGEKELRQSTRMDVRRYRLSFQEGTRARIEMMGERNDPSEVLGAMMRDDKAVLSVCVSLLSVPKEPGVQENILEVWYPTDFQIKGINWLGSEEGLYAEQRRLGRARYRHRFFGPPQDHAEKHYPFIRPPAEYEIKNTGPFVNAEFQNASEKSDAVMTKFTMEQVDLTGFTRRLNAGDPAGGKLFDYYPNFLKRTSTENRALPVGKWVLQAFHKRPAPFNDVEITIVRIKTNHVQFTHQKL